MGGKCCKCKCCAVSGGAQHQVVLLGPEASGKTTLLYKLKLPEWDPHDLKKDLTRLREPPRSAAERPRDPGYHYEEIDDSRRLGKYGIWDVPGNDAFIRMWPMFYRYINVSAVLYVVDASAEGIKNGDSVAQARRLMRFLLNEDELRVAAFFLILNVHQLDEKKGQQKSGENADFDAYEHVETVKEMLQVSKIEDEPWNKNRFRSFAVDCAEVSKHDPKWVAMIDDVYRVFLSVGRGSA